MAARADLVNFTRDGDQFHYLWAARRCLQLLSTSCDLVAISIEAASPDELPNEPPTRAGEQVIDIAEYFGSEDIQEARLVRYIQLKHSTLHATRPWTASGLRRTIEGFAERYQELCAKFSAEVLATKLQFSFVTNRPFAANFVEAVADAADGATPRHPEELRKLERFAKLTGDALTAFSTLLRFEGRQDDYWQQRNILFQDVHGHLAGGDVDGPLRLKELVTRKAGSEGRENPTITKMDVLRALYTDESSLFPAPCLIENLGSAVPRIQEANFIRSIVDASVPVVIHASAGVGKTVFATRISDGLPNGSTCILYDCFGNGQYRNASGYRHRHRDALVQIANELAAKRLCHLLIPTTHADVKSYMQAFLHRIDQAAELIRLADRHALLCIVIDAADNAQMAAEEIGEKRSFVRDLILEKMPDNVRLVFLCRSHRQDYLKPPVETIRCELEPFSREETAVHLRQRFADANEHDIDEFHRLSSHNPRVQASALSRHDSLPDTLRLLGPNPTTVEDIIGSSLEAAIATLKDSVGAIESAQVDKICTGLAVLRPLIPIPVLSQMSGVDSGAIRSFAIDIGRPLLLVDNSILFRDEPAETWFRDNFKPSADDMSDFVAGLKPLARTSAYAASVLPQLMLEAGEFSELVELALTSAALPDTSPLEKRDVELQRLQFALKAGLRSKRYADAAKLTLKAGGETAGDDRRRKVLQTNTDLAATFLQADVIQEVVSRRTFASGWLGSQYAYEAALLSGRPELVSDGRSRLRMAYEWLRNWGRLTPEERDQEKISDQDVIALTLAEINIHGPAEGARSLGRWQPREVSFRVGRAVTRRLIDHNRLQDVEAFANAATDNLCLVLAITIELRKIQRTPPVEATARAFRRVARKLVRLKETGAWDDRGSTLDAMTALVESALRQAVCTTQEAGEVLARYLPSEPPRALTSRFTRDRVPLLRAYCLRAALESQTLQLHDLAHANLRDEMDKRNAYSQSRDLREFREVIGTLLPWYQLWASAVLGRVTKANFDGELRRTREASERAVGLYYRDDFYTSNEIALLWMDILQKIDAADASALTVFSQWKDGLDKPLFTPTLTTLARLCSQNEATRGATIQFCLEAYKLTEGERADAESKADGYVDVARAVLSISTSDAEAYFNEAVRETSKIGEENLWRWGAILDLADHAARPDRPVAEVAYDFARCAELTYDYVAQDEHFDWHATVEALCDLCPSSSFAILSRWRDRGFGSSERILPIAVQHLIKSGRLDPRDALPLIGFHAQWTYDQLLESVLAKYTGRDEMEIATRHLFRYMMFEGGDFTKLKEVVSQHNLTVDGLDDVVVFGEVNDRTSNVSEYEWNDDFDPSSTKPARNWDGVFAGSDLTSADGLGRVHAKFKRTGSGRGRDNFFEEAIGRVPPGLEAAFVGAVGDNPEFDLYDFRDFLRHAPDAWNERPATMHAMASILRTFCRRYCMDIAKYRHYEMLPFEKACTLAGMSEMDLFEIVLDGVGESPDSADANRLFSLVGLLASRLEEDEALDALRFGLSLFAPVLEGKDGDGPWSSQLVPPKDIEISLAGYIWASMAAPEAVRRWEGAHVVLGLVALRREDMLGHVIKFATEKGGQAFVDARLTFYGLHALQWLLIGLSRAAEEFPEVVAPHSAQLVDWALNDQDHVLLRHFAARAALSLIDSGILADQEDLKGRLSRVNLSPHPVVEFKFHEPITSKTEVNNDDRFFFGIDIGPYWYEPLGRVFGLAQTDIEAEALNVIRVDLDFSGTGRWDEDERARRNIHEDGHTSHSHGSYPRADSLHFYHAYHAMMIVAGKLLASTPVHFDSDYGDKDAFMDWLRGHDLSRKRGRWLWDRRDPPPQERPGWLRRRKDSETPGIVTRRDFNQALESAKMLNVWGHWIMANADWEMSTSVRSALVTPERSAALLRALGTAKNVHDYGIPSAGSDMEIDESGFVLKGWIVDDISSEGLDGQDRWSGDISWPPPMPARNVIDLTGIDTDPDLRFWRDKKGSVVMASQVWGRYDEANRHEAADPECGARLMASLNFVTTMLSKLDRDLIIKVNINRHRRYKPYERYEDVKKRIPTKARLYLLGTDGCFRTLP